MNQERRGRHRGCLRKGNPLKLCPENQVVLKRLKRRLLASNPDAMPLSPFVIKVRELRRNLTPEERILWGLQRNRKLSHLKFLRQHPFVFGGPEVGRILRIKNEELEEPTNVFNKILDTANSPPNPPLHLVERE